MLAVKFCQRIVAQYLIPTNRASSPWASLNGERDDERSYDQCIRSEYYESSVILKVQASLD